MKQEMVINVVNPTVIASYMRQFQKNVSIQILAYLFVLGWFNGIRTMYNQKYGLSIRNNAFEPRKALEMLKEMYGDIINSNERASAVMIITKYTWPFTTIIDRNENILTKEKVGRNIQYTPSLMLKDMSLDDLNKTLGITKSSLITFKKKGKKKTRKYTKKTVQKQSPPPPVAVSTNGNTILDLLKSIDCTLKMINSKI